MDLRKVFVCIAGAFAFGFLVSEFASVPRAHAQSGFQIYVQVSDSHENLTQTDGGGFHKAIHLQGSKVVGFSCADGTCYIATQ